MTCLANFMEKKVANQNPSFALSEDRSNEDTPKLILTLPRALLI